jgi:hypothetical protein
MWMLSLSLVAPHLLLRISTLPGVLADAKHQKEE